MTGRPAATAPRPYRFPDFVRHELANGLRVWLVPLPDRELVSVHLLTDAGAASEDEPQAGVAALTAQLLVTGTQRLDAGEFAETTERLGDRGRQRIVVGQRTRGLHRARGQALRRPGSAV